MSENLKYLKKEDLNKLDEFIQESLDKYYYVKAWDQLYNNTGKNHKDIISDKSTIPDLVIYNKGFNKLDCFYYPKVTKEKVKFPRKLFILKPKKLKQYDPSSAIININSKIQKEKKEEKKEEIFEFKSIPKEIENKFIGDNKPEENKLLSELNDFMKNDKDDKPKVEVIKEEEKNDNGNQNKNNNYYNQRNKFNIPNMNNSNDYYLKVFQNIHYQNLINQHMRANNNLNKNNTSNISNSPMNKEPEIKPISGNANNINTNINVKNNMTDSMKYYSKEGDDENKEIQSYMQNMEEFMRNNMVERIWIVFNEKNRLVRKYNNEELYYLLNIILKTDEIKNNSIYFYKFPDVFVPPQEIFDILKKIFQKK